MPARRATSPAEASSIRTREKRRRKPPAHNDQPTPKKKLKVTISSGKKRGHSPESDTDGTPPPVAPLSYKKPKHGPTKASPDKNKELNSTKKPKSQLQHRSPEVIELFDSDEEQATQKTKEPAVSKERSTSDVIDLCSDDDDSPAPVKASKPTARPRNVSQAKQTPTQISWLPQDEQFEPSADGFSQSRDPLLFSNSTSSGEDLELSHRTAPNSNPPAEPSSTASARAAGEKIASPAHASPTDTRPDVGDVNQGHPRQTSDLAIPLGNTVASLSANHSGSCEVPGIENEASESDANHVNFQGLTTTVDPIGEQPKASAFADSKTATPDESPAPFSPTAIESNVPSSSTENNAPSDSQESGASPGHSQESSLVVASETSPPSPGNVPSEPQPSFFLTAIGNQPGTQSNLVSSESRSSPPINTQTAAQSINGNDARNDVSGVSPPAGVRQHSAPVKQSDHTTHTTSHESTPLLDQLVQQTSARRKPAATLSTASDRVPLRLTIKYSDPPALIPSLLTPRFFSQSYLPPPQCLTKSGASSAFTELCVSQHQGKEPPAPATPAECKEEVFVAGNMPVAPPELASVDVVLAPPVSLESRTLDLDDVAIAQVESELLPLETLPSGPTLAPLVEANELHPSGEGCPSSEKAQPAEEIATNPSSTTVKCSVTPELSTPASHLDTDPFFIRLSSPFDILADTSTVNLLDMPALPPVPDDDDDAFLLTHCFDYPDLEARK